MLTEDEARKRWCPFIRHGQDAANSWNQLRNPVPCRCIASECMAWRWSQVATGWRVQVGGGQSEAIEFGTSSTHGYCGLAGGKP